MLNIEINNLKINNAKNIENFNVNKDDFYNIDKNKINYFILSIIMNILDNRNEI